MKKYIITFAVLTLLLPVLNGQLLAAPPPGGTLPELVGDLQDWNFNAGYVVLDGKRYPSAHRVEVLSHDGEILGEQDLERGAQAGLFEMNGQVRRIVLFR